MVNQYKYVPEQFVGMLCISDELQEFYNLFENYKCKKNEQNRIFLEKQLNDLLFAIKHRVVEGRLTNREAEDLRRYVKGLLDD